jgi:hypothetical protein
LRFNHAQIVNFARRKYPDVVIHLMAGLTAQVEQWTKDGKVDLGFVLKTKHIWNWAPLAASRMLLVRKPGDHLTN